MMKINFSYFLCFAFSFIFLLPSCGKDGDDFSGTWELEFISSTNCDDPTDNLSFDLSDNNCIQNSGIEICVDGSFTFEESGIFPFMISTATDGFPPFTFTEAGTYSLSGNNITLCEAGETDCETGSYTISGDELTISSTDPEDGCNTVVRLIK